ncbi:MAG: CPBP family intramembrane metalloprotease [Deltaproteobacteria bacterium]|nr:CPBP family intramembrane metalloprotease [Deltaproteobacteria bacterium]
MSAERRAVAFRTASVLTSLVSAIVFALVAAFPLQVSFLFVRARLLSGAWPLAARLEELLTSPPDPTSIALAVASSSLGLMISLLVVTFRERDRFELFRLRPVPVRLLAIASASMLGVSVLMSSLIGLFELESSTLDELRNVFDAAGWRGRLAMVPVIGLVAGTCEELFFRGLVLERLRRVLSDRVSIAISAIMFGAMHLDPVHAVAAAAMGAVLGVVAVRTGSIVPCIVAHVVNNSVVTLVPELEGGGGLARIMVGTVSCAAAIFALRMLPRAEARGGTMGPEPARSSGAPRVEPAMDE